MSSASSRWFKMSTAFYLDTKIMSVSEPAQLLFLRGLAFVHATPTGGRITAEHVRVIALGMRGQARACRELVAAHLWGCCDADAGLCGVCGEDLAGMCREYVVIAYQKWATDQTQSAAQPAKKAAPASMGKPRAGEPAPARERRDETRVDDSPRSPPGSDRGESARTVPSRANGSTRPAPRMGELTAPWDPEPDRVESASKAAEQCRQTIRSSKKATGRNPMQSKWNREQNDRRSFADSMAPIIELLGDVE